LKWVLFACASFVVALGAEIALEAIGIGQPPFLVDAWISLSIIAIPIAATLAILRYRLYDIDRIVSRTVTYAAVAGVLAITYFGVVALLTTLLPPRSPLAVAGSTLVVAALFNPLRRRLHALVDRRFNRSRYDAEQVADKFARGLQDDLGQGGLTSGLLRVVAETMQPTVLSVWVRSETDPTT
jgi:divalent metal cation (Fe/Co/Zn/Cd) transporter